MAFIPITPDFIENLSVTTHPGRTFISSSDGVTGSIKVFGKVSPVEKEAQSLSSFTETVFDADSLEQYRLDVVEAAIAAADYIRPSIGPEANQPAQRPALSLIETYMMKVFSSSVSLRKSSEVSISRFEPGLTFNSGTLKKSIVRNTLFPWYRVAHPSLDWSVTNYNTLNFFSSSLEETPTAGSALIYPASTASASTTGYGRYWAPGPFTFDFYVNPRYSKKILESGSDGLPQHYRAGTILHMSSSYAVSLVSGSSFGIDGAPDKFRLMLQLSHSADIKPSAVDLTKVGATSIGGYANPGTAGDPFNQHDLIFLSSDNSLQFNAWNHVGIRWGTNTVNDGTGSFVVNGVVDASFVVPSSSIMPQTFGNPQGDPDALFVGNFYEGSNIAEQSAGSFTNLNAIQQFFNASAASTEGLSQDGYVLPIAGGTHESNGFPATDPPAFAFDHPLFGEVHELKMFSGYRSIKQLQAASKTSAGLVGNNLLLYIPPFFVKESYNRSVLQSPFLAANTNTQDPFNVAMSFGCGGHLLNLENFVREFSESTYPRLYNLTASTTQHDDVGTGRRLTADQLLFATASIRKRNLTILPNDNGYFRPNFDLLLSGTFAFVPSSDSEMSKFVNGFGSLNLGLISLENMIVNLVGTQGTTAPSLFPGLDGTEINDALSGMPEGVPVDQAATRRQPGNVFTAYQNTRDDSSNEVTFFNVPNLYYGNKIEPGSFSINDSKVTGSGDIVEVTLRDNGRGSMYRADAIGPHPIWTSHGNVLYEEGICVILTPLIPRFGKNKFKLELSGNQNIHVMEVQIPCPAGKINSSSNPAYQKLKPSDYANNIASEFVYITGLNFHDENLNVIARVNLAQPIVKTPTDKFLFKVKIDF